MAATAPTSLKKRGFGEQDENISSLFPVLLLFLIYPLCCLACPSVHPQLLVVTFNCTKEEERLTKSSHLVNSGSISSIIGSPFNWLSLLAT